MNVGAIIGLVFGLVWWLVGATALAAPARPVVQAGGVLLFAGAALRRPWRRGEPNGPARRRYYVAAVVAEVVAITIAVPWLGARGLGGYTVPVVGAIVGLHFVGLYFAFGRRRFLALAGGLTLVNLLALSLPPGARTEVSGFGSAVALLLSAVLP